MILSFLFSDNPFLSYNVLTQFQDESNIFLVFAIDSDCLFFSRSFSLEVPFSKMLCYSLTK